MTIPADWKADNDAHAGALAFAGARPLTNWHNVTRATISSGSFLPRTARKLGARRITALAPVFLQTLAHQSDRQICWCAVHIRKSLSSSHFLDGFNPIEKDPQIVGTFGQISGGRFDCRSLRRT